jgi:hypothetical protein
VRIGSKDKAMGGAINGRRRMDILSSVVQVERRALFIRD